MNLEQLKELSGNVPFSSTLMSHQISWEMYFYPVALPANGLIPPIVVRPLVMHPHFLGVKIDKQGGVSFLFNKQ